MTRVKPLVSLLENVKTAWGLQKQARNMHGARRSVTSWRTFWSFKTSDLISISSCAVASSDLQWCGLPWVVAGVLCTVPGDARALLSSRGDSGTELGVFVRDRTSSPARPRL